MLNGWETGARSDRFVNEALFISLEVRLIFLSLAQVSPFLGVLVMLQGGDGAGLHSPRANTCTDLSTKDAAPRAAVKPHPDTLPKPEEMQ